MAKCDLCGEDCKASQMVQLMDQYKAAGVSDICGPCERWANKLKSDLLDEIRPQIRAAVAARKAEQSAPRVRWWRLLSRVRGLKAT